MEDAKFRFNTPALEFPSDRWRATKLGCLTFSKEYWTIRTVRYRSLTVLISRSFSTHRDGSFAPNFGGLADSIQYVKPGTTLIYTAISVEYSDDGPQTLVVRLVRHFDLKRVVI